jgi:hypothetical protein
MISQLRDAINGQDIVEYALRIIVILVFLVGAIWIVGQ